MSTFYVWAAVMSAPGLLLVIAVMAALVVHLDHRVDQLREDARTDARHQHDLEIRNAVLERQLEAAVDFLSADLADLPTGTPDQEM